MPKTRRAAKRGRRPDGTRALARAIRDVAQGHGERAARIFWMGEVTNLDPLKVALTESRIVLDEDDLDFSQWVEFYDDEWGVGAGDTLVILHDQHGEWVALDVISDTDATLHEGATSVAEEGEEDPNG